MYLITFLTHFCLDSHYKRLFTLDLYSTYDIHYLLLLTANISPIKLLTITRIDLLKYTGLTYSRYLSFNIFVCDDEKLVVETLTVFKLLIIIKYRIVLFY